MGKCRYCRKFIPNFPSVAAPLFASMSKNKAWTPQCQNAFECVKQALKKEPVLAHPHYDKDFCLVGLGAMLLHKHEGGECVVAHASMSLYKHEKNWTLTELEAAALICAFEVFRPYIHGIRGIIMTDHASLEHKRDKTAKRAGLTRRGLRLQEYQYTIEHRPGSKQKHVDASVGLLFSRHPRNTCVWILT